MLFNSCSKVFSKRHNFVKLLIAAGIEPDSSAIDPGGHARNFYVFLLIYLKQNIIILMITMDSVLY